MSTPRKPVDEATAERERNEYIPSYISKKPFYIPDEISTSDYLEHQRLQKPKDDSSKWYNRGKLGPAATKFRKGACENCGAMTHKTKECLNRPRKKGAKWTGKDIQADEKVQAVELGWDAKRDRWNGYDASEFKTVVDEYEQVENMKRQLKGGEEQSDDEEESRREEAKYAEESDMGRHQPTSTRNLRLREDTAKYLVNLDLESAKYDPKTRSMVDKGASLDDAATLVAEDNFERASGDAAEFEKAQKYAWETQERGDRDRQHLQAMPTSGEYTRKKQAAEENEKRTAQRKALLEKYGGESHLQSAPLRDAAVTESEKYAEYDDLGQIKSKQKKDTKSKYAEDLFVNNHTSVWGSWWHDFVWGYQCCHSTVRNSYCTGEAGKRAFEEAEDMRIGGALEVFEDEQLAKEQDEDIKTRPQIDGSSRSERKEADAPVRKRTLQEMRDDITEEEVDEYRKRKTVADDPMAGFLGMDQPVH